MGSDMLWGKDLEISPGERYGQTYMPRVPSLEASASRIVTSAIFFVATPADTIPGRGSSVTLSNPLLARLLFSYFHFSRVYQVRLRSVKQGGSSQKSD
jgi:hypothetical protein